MIKLKALVIGATGATGRELVNTLINDEDFNQVSIFVRKAPDLEHEKLKIHIIDFNEIIKHKELIKGDILFSSLGTTKKEAGGKQRQYIIDYTYQYEFAKIAAENGVDQLSLVSSIGANPKSFMFYPKMKGKLESDVKKLKFKKIDIFQPPILIRQPEVIRKVEKKAISIIQKLNKLGILKSQQPLMVSNLAERMVKTAKTNSKEKVNTYLPKELFN
jgi:nucleoside-diphosphate-sugar epimerase